MKARISIVKKGRWWAPFVTDEYEEAIRADERKAIRRAVGRSPLLAAWAKRDVLDLLRRRDERAKREAGRG